MVRSYPSAAGFWPKLLCLTLCLALCAGSGALAQQSATVDVDLTSCSEWAIDLLLFGSFYEEHFGDITPGIYEQYIVNPSFEPWYDGLAAGMKDIKTRIVFADVPTTTGVAYPWEPSGDASFQTTTATLVNSSCSQVIHVTAGATGSVRQRLALPHNRVLTYRLRFYARCEGDISVQAQLLDDPARSNILDSKALPGLSDTWQSFEVVLDLHGKLPATHRTVFGIGQIGIVATGSGSLYIDQATLFPTDCVEGRYNPQTIENIARYKPTLIRWPGGNYTSGYHWRDGIGPLDQRPTRPNLTWGGLAENHVGTDEWLRFCEIAGVEPVICGGFSNDISASELAQWVEYCNGSTSTTLGALRAANGHPAPYKVKYWGIGNEVYGRYQIGNTDAHTYAAGFIERARAMKAADPSIQVIATGFGVHNDYADPDNAWNDTVLAIAGNEIDLLDTHHYVYGPDNATVTADGWQTAAQAFLGADARISAYHSKLRSLLDSRPSTRNIRLVHHEWGVLPRAQGRVPLRQTFLNALCTAAQYHAFFRDGDLLRQGALHNFSYYFNPVPGHSEPPNPRSEISRLYASFAGAHLVRSSYSGPTFSVDKSYRDIGSITSSSLVDALVLQSEGATQTIHVCLINKSLDQTCEVSLRFGGLLRGSLAPVVKLYRANTEDGYDEYAPYRWETPKPVFRVVESPAAVEEDEIKVSLPKLSLGYLRLEQPLRSPSLARDWGTLD